MKNFKRSYFFIIFLNFNFFANAIPLRIVSLAPNLTEIVYALKLQNNLVGVTRQCDYPLAVKSKHSVGDYAQPNLEEILMVHPTVVLATEGSPRALLNKLKELHIGVVETNPMTISELPASIQKIANALGESKSGVLLANAIHQSIEHLKSHARRPKSFLLALQLDPVYSVSNNTWLGDLFSTAGYHNVVGESIVKYPVVSREFLIKNTPEIIFLTQGMAAGSKKNRETVDKSLEAIFYPASLKRIKIINLPPDILMRAGPRIVEGIRFIESLE